MSRLLATIHHRRKSAHGPADAFWGGLFIFLSEEVRESFKIMAVKPSSACRWESTIINSSNIYRTAMCQDYHSCHHVVNTYIRSNAISFKTLAWELFYTVFSIHAPTFTNATLGNPRTIVCAWKSSHAGTAKSVANLSPSRLRFKDANTAKESPLDRVKLALEAGLMNFPPCVGGARRNERPVKQRICRRWWLLWVKCRAGENKTR
jgi:hypothetical protein